MNLAQVTAMVARVVRGMSQSLGCSVSKVTCMVADRMQTMQMKKRRSDVKLSSHGSDSGESALVSVVCDTAATMPVAGADLSGVVSGLKKVPVSVRLDTAQGTAVITEAVDIPKSKGLMDKALVVDNCSRSLCSMVTVCESKNLGFEIDAGRH